MGFRNVLVGIPTLIFFTILGCQQPVSSTTTSLMVWQGSVAITKDVTISSGQTLRILPGTTVRAQGDFRVVAIDGASIQVEGTETQPVRLLSGVNQTWGGLVVSGPGSLTVRHCEVTGGPLIAKNGASLLIEDSLLHDYYVDAPPIVYTYEAKSAYLNRVHVWNYYETNFVRTVGLIENSLFERMIGDGIDFDNSPSGTLIRNCTLRNATNWNVDAIDFGVVFYPHGSGSRGSVENCLIYDVTDKGVSVGEQAQGITISNTLIHHVGIGISAKDGSVVSVSQVTLADNNYGINSYEERSGMGGGVLTADHVVILGNLVGTQILDGATLALTESAVDSDTDSLDSTAKVAYLSDPEAEYADRDARDYRLNTGSSLLGYGYGGSLGAPSSGPTAVDVVPTPVKVALYGNSRSGKVHHEKIVSILSLEESPDLVINTGDIVSDGANPSDWLAFDSVVKPLLKIAPFYPVPGPREGESAAYYNQFQLPTKLSSTEHWYAVQKEGALFLQLNSNILARNSSDPDYLAQMAWLETMLTNSTVTGSDVKFRFVTLNAPLYSVGTAAEPDPLTTFPNHEALVTLLTDPRWRVDMVFSGHHAFYEREMFFGLPWIILGGGGAPHDVPRDGVLNSQSVIVPQWHYALLEIRTTSAVLKVLDLEGNLIDTWTVTK